MKRVPEHKKLTYGITKIKTWFKWVRCDVCDNEFRREPMWKIFIYSDINIWSNIFHYACQECVKSLESAIIYRKNIKKKLGIPPPSPMKNI